MRFSSREPIRPEWTVPPVEAREAAAQLADIGEIDRRLTAIALMRLRGPGRADSLLDRRNAIRPARVTQVLVIPGRAS